MSWRSSARLSRRQKVTLNHPIFTRWPAQHPDQLQLFSLPTPNGVKVGIMLEETSLAYEPHRIDIMAGGKSSPALPPPQPHRKKPPRFEPTPPGGPPPPPVRAARAPP